MILELFSSLVKHRFAKSLDEMWVAEKRKKWQ